MSFLRQSLISQVTACANVLIFHITQTRVIFVEYEYSDYNAALDMVHNLINLKQVFS